MVALLGLEPFVEGGIDWSVRDDLTEPDGAFYAPNNDMPMPATEQAKVVLQEWFFPGGDSEAMKAMLGQDTSE